MLLTIGSYGDKVREIERILNRIGYTSVHEDAYFSETTEQAVKSFQRKMGLVVDGLVGPKTLDRLKANAHNSKYLKQAHLVQAAETLGVPVANIMAVIEVESNGSGFEADGRVKILFERHVMFTRLKAAGYPAETLASKNRMVVNLKRGGYRGGSAEYMRLKSAQYIDSDIALESCSWGQFQIMGYHWQALGYSSVVAFAEAMQTSELEQLNAFVKFIEIDAKLHKALKDKKWETFARIYNGPAYKTNFYDIKLARAYSRYNSDLESLAA